MSPELTRDLTNDQTQLALGNSNENEETKDDVKVMNIFGKIKTVEEALQEEKEKIEEKKAKIKAIIDKKK